MDEFVLADVSELDIEKTFECGQCFRWNADSEGTYSGIAMGWPAKLWNQDGKVIIRTDGPRQMWRDYFGMELDYAQISQFDGGEYLDKCVKYGMGIRILNQDPWETLCSFIISQCNNITRIKGIVERLSLMYGNKIEFDGGEYYTFPEASILSELDSDDLAPLRAGYRAPYIINAARAVSSGRLNLNELIETDFISAKNALLSLNGVGEKVANCVVLFGLRHMEGFPIDVWIRRALKENFPPDFDIKRLGKYAGLAQQYIFYYARSGGK